jgi:hypothetical protein
VRWHPARCRSISGAWDELAAGTPGDDAPVGVTFHPDIIRRTAGDVTRMSGGGGGGRPRGSSLSRCAPGMARSAVPGAGNRKAKADRDVTRGCQSRGDRDDRDA